MFESEATTRGVRVQVKSVFVPERSSPEEGQWFFAYHIVITNSGSESVQLLTRHWIITDGNGTEEEVRGPGVIGEQPVLEEGESFEYTSACPLETSVGTMRGSYLMITQAGVEFDAEIAPFTLGEKRSLH